MNYGNIKFNDIANGPGVRVSLFVSGCRNHCPGCFNPETWDFNYGKEFTNKTIMEIVNELNKPQYQGLTILGGDPLEPENIRCVADICGYVKYMLPDKDIWLYTGYILEDKYKDYMSKSRLTGKSEDIITDIKMSKMCKFVDVIVDGPFIQEQKDISLQFRGSKNQRIIDMSKSRKQQQIVLWGE